MKWKWKFSPTPFFPSLSIWLFKSPDVLGPGGGSWQGHPAFSCLSKCCFWWRRDNNYLGSSFFSSSCVCCVRPLFSLYCWSRDTICCRRLHHPSHLAVMLCARVVSVSIERLCLCLYMCRYALGMCVFPCWSCCERVSTKTILAVSPYASAAWYIEHLQTGRLCRWYRTQ